MPRQKKDTTTGSKNSNRKTDRNVSKKQKKQPSQSNKKSSSVKDAGVSKPRKTGRTKAPKKSIPSLYHEYDRAHYIRTVSNEYAGINNCKSELPDGKNTIISKNGAGKHAIQQQCIRRSDRHVPKYLNNNIISAIKKLAQTTAKWNYNNSSDVQTKYRRCQTKQVRQAFFLLTGMYSMSSYLKKTPKPYKKRKHAAKPTEGTQTPSIAPSTQAPVDDASSSSLNDDDVIMRNGDDRASSRQKRTDDDDDDDDVTQ
jgi:hypothetical protein